MNPATAEPLSVLMTPYGLVGFGIVAVIVLFKTIVFPTLAMVLPIVVQLKETTAALDRLAARLGIEGSQLRLAGSDGKDKP